MSALVTWIGWFVMVAATGMILGSGMNGFAEPDESRIGLVVWAVMFSIGLHAGLLAGLLGWKSLENLMPRIVIGLLMLPATILSGWLFIGASKQANWAGATAAFLMSGIYITVWIRILGGYGSSRRVE